MDRYLSYENVKSERDLCATSAACAMISVKILRAREECLSYDDVQYHFDNVSESRIRVSKREGREGGRGGKIQGEPLVKFHE